MKKVESAYLENAIGCAIALGLFFGGMSFAMVINKWKINSGDAATWAGAALAGLAFAGTIYLAISDRLIREKREQDLAAMRAMDFAIQATEIRKWYSSFVEMLNKPGVDLEKVINRIEIEIPGIPMWSTDELVNIICIPGNLAHDLLATLKTQDTIKFMLKLKSERMNGSPRQAKHVKTLHDLFSAAVMHMDQYEPKLAKFIKRQS